MFIDEKVVTEGRNDRAFTNRDLFLMIFGRIVKGSANLSGVGFLDIVLLSEHTPKYNLIYSVSIKTRI